MIERRTKKNGGSQMRRVILLLLTLALSLSLFQTGLFGFEFKETVVAGEDKDFMMVRHLVLHGSNHEIGKKLAQIAYSRHRSGPIPIPPAWRDKTEAQRRYFETHYPAFFKRMGGAAAAFEKEIQDNSWNFSGLFYGFPLAGCSVVFYPADLTSQGCGIVSRNFDFSTGTMYGTKPGPGQLPVCARPYVIEMYPEEGYASLVTCSFDLLGGVCDGINSEGLVVALLSSNDIIEEFGLKPAPVPSEGFNELQVLRCLLDTCANVEQAKQALRKAKLYYAMVPVHYIIADRYGNAFIWENSPSMDGGHIIDGNRHKPLVTTNFLQHRHPDPDKYPVEKHPLGWFNRFRRIKSRIDRHEGKFDDAFIKETNRSVSYTHFVPEGKGVAHRTLWHALYYPEKRRLEIDFYLGEKTDAASPENVKFKRSGYLTFTLKKKK
jgi:predicted choloylglycine hydrolase